jgi:hypothetical protein
VRIRGRPRFSILSIRSEQPTAEKVTAFVEKSPLQRWLCPLDRFLKPTVQRSATAPMAVKLGVTEVRETPKAIWVADAHRGDGKRFVVHADEGLTAFLELESAIRGG